MQDDTGEDARTGDDLIEGRECLVARIVEELGRQGYYLTHVGSHAGQALIDLRWAAQLAGRELGRRTRTYASTAGQRLPGMVTVIVAPVQIRPSRSIPGRDDDQVAIEELLAVHSSVSGSRRPA